MQYVGQTCRTLQKRFGEHYRRIRKPKTNDTFLYQHFKRTGHSPNDVIVQPVEKISYDENSSVRFKNIKRFETELKWIKLLQTPFPLGFNDNIYHEGNISKMPILMYLHFQSLGNVNLDLMVYGKKVMTNVNGALH